MPIFKILVIAKEATGLFVDAAFSVAAEQALVKATGLDKKHDNQYQNQNYYNYKKPMRYTNHHSTKKMIVVPEPGSMIELECGTRLIIEPGQY